MNCLPGNAFDINHFDDYYSRVISNFLLKGSPTITRKFLSELSFSILPSSWLSRIVDDFVAFRKMDISLNFEISIIWLWCFLFCPLILSQSSSVECHRTCISLVLT